MTGRIMIPISFHSEEYGRCNGSVQSFFGSDVSPFTLQLRRLLPLCTSLLFFYMIANCCAAQTRSPLCSNGNNEFHAIFRTRVGVTVQSGKNEGLSERECEATLHWETKKLVVAEHAAQIDLDMFGVDLKTDGPVAAFQIRETTDECCVSYQIYSLARPPRLLRTITGGSSFAASDRYLDGRIEIWTDDVAAVNGLDGLLAAEMEYPPTYVLRFEKGRLLDSSSEFRDYFDDIVKRIQNEIKSDFLDEFKLSDGRLRGDLSSDPSQLHRLRVVKIQILEIVWAYLYSGREQEAWSTLTEMWPAGDVERIRLAVMKARADGMLAHIDGVLTDRADSRKKEASIYNQSEVTPAQPIYLWRSPPAGLAGNISLDTEVVLDLVIDSAGKVSSVKLVGGGGTADAGLISAAKDWKFIPGMRNGHSVASRLRLITSVKR